MTDVSIVLITFNDAKRLPRALQSLRDQTLHSIEIIVVDDASSDETPKVVAAAMAADERVRSVRLPQNSGGCSAPRNAGINAATGTWVMFCDSDDEYERHAAKNLLLAAERADADLGCGVAERVDIKTGRSVRWRADLHTPDVLDSIMERPELIADTVSVNKIYRREWLIDQGITFPEGVLYEDQLFTIKAYAQARRIAVIDQTVYRWYVERLSGELSITQRRHEERNARSRIEVNRLIDDYLADRGLFDLERVKRRKFLAHDLYLYLVSMLEMDDTQAESVIEILHPYVSALDLEPAATLRPGLRIAIAHLLLRDVDGIRAAMRSISWSATIDMPIIQEGDHDLWACEHLALAEHLAGHEMRWWLDVTEYRLRFAGPDRERWCHIVDGVELHGRTLRVRGTTVDAFGRLARARSSRIVLMRDGVAVAELPATMRAIGDDRWAWQADGRLSASTRIDDGDGGAVSLAFDVDGGVNIGSLRTSSLTTQIGSGLGGAHGIRLLGGDYGSVRWHAGRFTPGAKARAAVARRWRSACASVRRAWLGLVRRVAAVLPASHEAVLASSRGIGGQPWVLAAALESNGIRVRWLADLRSRSTSRAWVLARARWFIQDADLVPDEGVAPHTEVVTVVEGLPMLRQGRDAPDWDITSQHARRPRPSQVRHWRLAVAPDAHLACLRTSTGYEGPVVHADPIGERLRTDAVPVHPISRDARRVVLYLPVDGRRVELAPFVAALGDRVVLVVASADGVVLPIPAVLQSSVVDASDEPDLARLIAAADLVVTDASPFMALVAQAGIPIIIHAPQLDDLASRRVGTVLDLRSEGPGPVTDSSEALIAAVGEALDRDCTVDREYADRALKLAAVGQVSDCVADVLAALRGGA